MAEFEFHISPVRSSSRLTDPEEVGMAETLHLELSGSPASADLIDYLAARRLAARLIDTGDCCELAFATSADERLRNATRQALRGWIAEPAGSLVVAEHEGRFVLRPPAV